MSVVRCSSGQSAYLPDAVGRAVDLNPRLLVAPRVAGVEPDDRSGVRLGDYNHLVQIGVISFLDALRLVDARGVAYDQGPHGWMAAVFPLTLDELTPLLEGTQAEHVRGPVLWQRGTEQVLRDHPGATLVQVGPGAALVGLLRRGGVEPPRPHTARRRSRRRFGRCRGRSDRFPDELAGWVRRLSREPLWASSPEARVCVGRAGIERWLPHREPFLRLDEVVAADPVRGRAIALGRLDHAARVPPPRAHTLTCLRRCPDPQVPVAGANPTRASASADQTPPDPHPGARPSCACPPASSPGRPPRRRPARPPPLRAAAAPPCEAPSHPGRRRLYSVQDEERSRPPCDPRESDSIDGEPWIQRGATDLSQRRGALRMGIADEAYPRFEGDEAWEPPAYALSTYGTCLHRVGADLAEAKTSRGWGDEIQGAGAWPFEASLQGGQETEVARVREAGERFERSNSSPYTCPGYARHPAVMGAAKAAIERHGIGAAISPVHGGAFAVHRDLERELLDFVGRPDCGVSLCSTGYAVNTVSDHPTPHLERLG